MVRGTLNGVNIVKWGKDIAKRGVDVAKGGVDIEWPFFF
jgi:hypothetical protein